MRVNDRADAVGMSLTFRKRDWITLPIICAVGVPSSSALT